MSLVTSGLRRTPGLHRGIATQAAAMLHANAGTYFYTADTGKPSEEDWLKEAQLFNVMNKAYEFLEHDHHMQSPIVLCDEEEIECFGWSSKQITMHVVKKMISKCIHLPDVDDEFLPGDLVQDLLDHGPDEIEKHRKRSRQFAHSLREKMIEAVVDDQPPRFLSFMHQNPTWETFYEYRSSPYRSNPYPFEVFKSKTEGRTAGEIRRDHLIDMMMYTEFTIQDGARVMNLPKNLPQDFRDGPLRRNSILYFFRDKTASPNSIYHAYTQLGLSTFVEK